MALPRPDSPRLRGLPISNEARQIYALLYKKRTTPLSMRQLRTFLPQIGSQEHFGRRERELNAYFTFNKPRVGTLTLYQLVNAKPGWSKATSRLSERDRAVVLALALCAMCGKTPLKDRVRLQLDHKIPLSWGGTNRVENLQPLCEQCNRGKKAHFASYRLFAPQIRRAMKHAAVHMRIGELLRAFKGRAVRSDLIAMVASLPGQVQEDWHKRLRELRVLGWIIRASIRREEGVVRSYYTLEKAMPWPDGEVRTAIRRGERLRGY